MTNSGFVIEISISWPCCIDLRAVCSVLQPVLGGEASRWMSTLFAESQLPSPAL